MNAPLQTQMKTPRAAPVAVSHFSSGLLQRKCACGGSPGIDGECTACRKKRLHRQPASLTGPTSVPSIVHEVLRSPGQPLDTFVAVPTAQEA